jgi:purine-binding chemotaxis protein CheW
MSLHVAFRVGSADYALPADQVLHLESYDGATHVPGAPAYVAGVVHVRGRVVPVVDLRTRFGLEKSESHEERRILVVQVGSRIAALLADSAREVLRIDDAAFERPPELIADRTAGFITGVATIAKRVFLRVDAPRLIGEELSDGQK